MGRGEEKGEEREATTRRCNQASDPAGTAICPSGQYCSQTARPQAAAVAMAAQCVCHKKEYYEVAQVAPPKNIERHTHTHNTPTNDQGHDGGGEVRVRTMNPRRGSVNHIHHLCLVQDTGMGGIITSMCACCNNCCFLVPSKKKTQI